MSVTDALIYNPCGSQSARWLDQCVIFCQAHRYNILAIVAEWGDIISYIRDGFRGVVVHPPDGQLPHDRLPRFECAADPLPTPDVRPASGQRRVHRRPQTSEGD